MRAGTSQHRAALSWGHILPFCVLGVCAVALWPILAEQNSAELVAYWREIGVAQWILAGIFAVISFWAVGKYDVIAHRHFRTGLSTQAAQRSGMGAIALSQTLGLGLITGCFARWRLRPELSVTRAAQITVFVTSLFILAMAIVVGLLVALSTFPMLFRLSGLGVALCGVLVCVLLVIKPRLSAGRWHIEAPTLPAMAQAIGWAGMDILAAALACFVLLPPDAALTFWAFFPIFGLALAAGILSGTPGGVGPFELAALSLAAVTTSAPAAALLVAIGGFRLVYYAIPAVLALGTMMWTRTDRSTPRAAATVHGLRHAPRAETQVLRQSGGMVLRCGQVRVGLWRTAQASVGLFDPFRRPSTPFFHNLRRVARNENRVAVLYKCRARTALAARTAGWRVLRMADDAVIDVPDFTLDTPSRSRLRRKLRKADGAGLTVRPVRARDMPALAALDLDWQSRVGPARGGTMGRFCPDYLKDQMVLVATVDACIVAFCSAHRGRTEWTIDVMRDGTDSPDGTMYRLVTDMIEKARDSGMSHLCLAAVPACPDPSSAAWRKIAAYAASMSQSAGLRHFKSAFAPRWVPLYMASPTRLSLLIGVMDIARAVFHPGPVSPPMPTRRNNAHDNDENYEVDSKVAA